MKTEIKKKIFPFSFIYKSRLHLESLNEELSFQRTKIQIKLYVQKEFFLLYKINYLATELKTTLLDLTLRKRQFFKEINY